MPGLTASVQEPYIINIIHDSLKNGYDVVVYSDRIYNERDLLSLTNKQNNNNNKQINLCLVRDFKDSMDFIKLQKGNFYNKNIYGIGHSFGANLLARYIGEFVEENIFKGCVLVSNPWDMLKTSELLDGISEKYIVESKISVLKEKKKFFTREIQ